MRQITLALLLSCACLSSLSANEEMPQECCEEVKRSSLYYLQLGASSPAGTPVDEFLVSAGIGARFQRDHYGLDLSISNGVMIFQSNYLSFKGLFLFYPYPEKKHQLYFGVGPGLACYSYNPVFYNIASVFGILLGVPYEDYSYKRYMVNLETVLGYEFRFHSHFKTFIQLEVSQPTFSTSGRFDRQYRYRPGVALTVGMGF